MERDRAITMRPGCSRSPAGLLPEHSGTYDFRERRAARSVRARPPWRTKAQFYLEERLLVIDDFQLRFR